MFKRSKRVYIVGGDLSYSSMFLNEGWIVTNDLLEAQLVQFTGGSDVTPSFYNELKHPKIPTSPQIIHLPFCLYIQIPAYIFEIDIF